MRVLIVGSGAREHALASGLRSCDVIVTPGNAATPTPSVPVRADDLDGLVNLALKERVDLVVVGPEVPLVLGLVDRLEDAGIKAFGPTRAAARLEGSKAFMKHFCATHGIATSPFAVFDDADRASAYIEKERRPLVVKADGLAAGKGVVVAQTSAEALWAVDQIMRARVFGAAGDAVVIEDVLGGEEASFHVICDGERAFPLAAAQDHKRVGDGDRGPNTGGMGAYAPAPVVTDEIASKVMERVVGPTLRGMAQMGAPFRGVLFVGLMIEHGEPRVLEFNVRFGDPETSVIVPLVRLAGPGLLEVLDAAARGKLSELRAPTWNAWNGAAMAVVMAADGYPGAPRLGDRIRGLDASLEPGAFVFHAGTKRLADGAVVTAGGRVLAVGGLGATLGEAHRIAYGAVGAIHWDGEHHRSDIGHRALVRGGA